MFSLLPATSLHPMLDIVDTGPIPNVVPAPSALLFVSRMLFDIHCTYCWREEYREVAAEEKSFRQLLWGVVLDKTLGSSSTLQIAAQVVLIMRRAIEVSKKVHEVYIKWDELLVVWLSPYPTETSTPATNKTECEFLCEQISWKISTLYAQINPLATAIWNLSISYRLLIKAFGTTKKARSKAVKTLFVNLAAHEQLLKELRDNKPLVENILRFFYIRTPADEWINQLDETVKTIYKVQAIPATAATTVGNAAGIALYRAKVLVQTFLNPASA